ncbi:MAG: DUF2202 domain-containing protein [Bacteroidales bacterium]|nr:DUF2202 domain-containing protein [Bacteroidales bacterium]
MKRLIFLGILFSACFSGYSQCAKDTGIGTYTPSDEEIESLKFLREEELLAGDVYEFLSTHYDIPVFKNISKSEDVHTGRIKMLLTRYQVDDPAQNHEDGKFENRELQNLYDELTATGKISLDSAIVVGLMIEEKDIKDLQEALDTVIKAEDIRAVYAALKRASGNHLRAFYSHAENRNISYTPRFLDKKSFEEALTH